MTASNPPSAANDIPFPLESVICTSELKQRPARPADHAAENRALVALSQTLADSPGTILDNLVDTLQQLCNAGSAGISLLAKDEQSFFWAAIAGAWKAQAGGGTPRDFGPCGDVLDSNGPLLFKRMARRYTYLAENAGSSIEEALLVPFFVHGKAIGAIWVMAHDDTRKFDAEDLRQLESLARFAAAAYQAVKSSELTLKMLEEQAQSYAASASLNTQLLQSGRLYSALFDSMDEGFCIIEKIEVETDQKIDFRYIQANPAFALHSGLVDVVGKTLNEVVAPVEAEEWCAIYDGVLRTGISVQFERELVIHSRQLELNAFRVDDDTHRRVGVSFKDVTERKKNEKLLRGNAETISSMIENSPFGTYVIDSRFCLWQVSKASQKVFENINPLIGRDFADVLQTVWPPEFASEAIQRFRHTLDTGEPYSAPSLTSTRHNIDEVESYDWTIRRITLPDGQFGVVCYFHDVTERKAAEDALRYRTQQFETLLDQAPTGVFLVDANLDICQANPMAQRAFKALPDMVGKSLAEAMHLMWPPVLASDIVNRFIQTLETGKPYVVTEWLEQSKNGQSIGAFDWQIDRIALADGQYGVVCYFRSIHKQIEAQRQIRESEERYRNLFTSMDEGFCIIEMMFDANNKAVDYRFVEVNPSFVKQSGMHDVVGKRVREVIPDLEEHWFEIYGQVALTGKPIRFVNEVKALNRWLDIYAARLGNSDTRQVAIIFNNITERTKIEEALRRSEERFRALFDSGPLAMYTVDATGVVQEFNQVAVLLWGREPKRGDLSEMFCGAHRLYWPDGRLLRHDETPVAAVLKGVIPFAHDVEVIMERPDGSRITVIANIVPLKNVDGELTGAINCLYDITERSMLERKTQEQAEALADLHRRKDEFLAMLSHELRNPLAPISNSLQLLGLQKNEGPLQRQARLVIERQVGQLKHLVNDLLEVARITSGRVQLRQQLIDAREILDSAVETTRPLILERKHKLTLLRPAHPVWLQADPSRLEQVLVNLLTNAAKYTDEGGQIILGLEQDAACATISVQDNGIGIAPELLPKVFDLFTQAERSLDRSQGGLGIGLSLVRQLIDLHGGHVEVNSTLGQGSLFSVRLPIMPSSLMLTSLPIHETPDAHAARCRVLVVDDNMDAAQSLVDLLELSGHETRIEHEGVQALNTAIAWRPDVLLLDIGLPGLNGFEIARRIRQDASLSAMVLVALTGYGQESDRRRSQDAGFDHHIVKPASFAQVEKILASVVVRVA